MFSLQLGRIATYPSIKLMRASETVRGHLSSYSSDVTRAPHSDSDCDSVSTTFSRGVRADLAHEVQRTEANTNSAQVARNGDVVRQLLPCHQFITSPASGIHRLITAWSE